MFIEAACQSPPGAVIVLMDVGEGGIVHRSCVTVPAGFCYCIEGNRREGVAVIKAACQSPPGVFVVFKDVGC